MTARVALVGECMIELRQDGADTLAVAYAGDTLNSAVYLARSAPADVQVDYVTVLGEDPHSARMLARWQTERVGTSLVRQVADRLPGLYLIEVDDRGERSFLYYRSESAARLLFSDRHPSDVDDALAEYDLVCFSGITLAILGDPARERLWGLVDRIHDRGGQVAFDSNYRPRLWPSADVARQVIGLAQAGADVLLCSADDEALLFGDRDAEASLHRLVTGGKAAEVVVKCGELGCLVASAGGTTTVPAVEAAEVVDTTAAGDAFNGGYLAARLAGADPVAAAHHGAAVAAQVVAHPGAIIPRP